MKKYIYIWVLLLCMLYACNQQKSPVNSNKESANIEFLSKKDYEFGMLSIRDTLYHTFLFKNIGNTPFVINHVESSCGCLRVVYPKYPVMPNNIDSICFIYDGNGFNPGRFIKSCTIYSNANRETPITLIIRGGFCNDL